MCLMPIVSIAENRGISQIYGDIIMGNIRKPILSKFIFKHPATLGCINLGMQLFKTAHTIYNTIIEMEHEYEYHY